jgi:hypothetical protein
MQQVSRLMSEKMDSKYLTLSKTTRNMTMRAKTMKIMIPRKALIRTLKMKITQMIRMKMTGRLQRC